jgi:hypothetical protein
MPVRGVGYQDTRFARQGAHRYPVDSFPASRGKQAPARVASEAPELDDERLSRSVRLTRSLRTRSGTTAVHSRNGECPCRRHAAGMARRAARSRRSSIRCATADDVLGPVAVGPAVAGTRFNPAPAMPDEGSPSRKVIPRGITGQGR